MRKKVKLFFLLQISTLNPLLAIVLILIPTLSAGPDLLHDNLILLGNFAVLLSSFYEDDNFFALVFEIPKLTLNTKFEKICDL